MLEAATPRAGFYDVLAIEDPDYRRAEALSLAINDFLLDHSNEHSIVRIAALAHVLIGYLRDAPPPYRNRMIASLLDDIRDKADCSDA